VNDAVPVSTEGLVTTAQLAALPDFTLGLALISPSTRTLAGPGGTADIEPRVMQVLVVLAESAGQVVTRETLFTRCWGGVYVGDDSLNRAVAAVRKLAADIAGASFEIETIPRTGYRLVGAMPQETGPGAPNGLSQDRRLTRRQMGAGALGAAAFAGLGYWGTTRFASNRRFDGLVEQSEKAIREDSADQQTARMLQEAVAMRPQSAKAWGLLAFLRSIDTASADPKMAEPARNEAQDAARRALAIDPRQPYALLAMFELQGSTLDWAARDARLRQIIAIDPDNIPAIGELTLLTQAAGLNRESWTWNERALALQPLSPNYLSKRAMKLWIAGRASNADKVIDQVVALYPTNPWPQWVRFMILALTGRPRAARGVLESVPQIIGGPSELSLWRSFLAAIETPSPQSLAKAREAAFDAATTAGAFTVPSVMILCALGQADAAFEIADGFLLSRGLVVSRGSVNLPTVSDGKVRAEENLNDATWRINTQYLFTPPCAIMRTEPRFLALCEGVGLVDYWRRRGVRPDYQSA
jgi:DNA-binding winged helix-turn-helix (wHTH) protein